MAMKLEGISEKKHCQTDSFQLVNVLPEGCSGHKRLESVKYPPESVILDWNMQLSLVADEVIAANSQGDSS